MANAAVEPAPLINLRWLIRLRWLAVTGQVTTILVGERFLTHPLPVKQLLTVCAALAVGNLCVMLWLYRGGIPSDRASGLNLLGDIAALTALLALSGGAFNPFSVLYLVHITIAAVILPARWTLLLAFASATAYSVLQMVPFGRLVFLTGEDQALMQVRGTWVAFLVAAAFISTFSFRMSQALRRREAELMRVRQDAEATERLAALGTLAAATAHELNTPLGTIAILAGELADQVEGERRTEAEEIRKQVRRCKEIITSMLAPRGDAAIEEPKEFELAPVIESCVQRWQQGRPGPKPQFSVEASVARARARLPLHAFEQAIANLLDNAAEATEGKSSSEIRIALSRSGEDLKLTVADNGIGVPEPLKNRIGMPFFTTKGPGRGSGLGLYLARHVFERQGGEMEVVSAEGQGTQVVLLVPEANA